jgi:hypothetical protein
VGAGGTVFSDGGVNGGRLVSRKIGTKNAAAATIAIHEQQTRIATIAAMILGVDEDWVLPVSIERNLLKCFVHLTLKP